MSELPPLPKGFVLDDGPQASETPRLPAGFTLDAPQSNQMVSAVTDIPSEIYSAGKSALGSIGEHLNPFSQSRIDSIERQSRAGFGDAGLRENLSQIFGVGKGLAAIPELAMSPVTGTARSAIGHPYSALTGMPYEQAKDAVDTAMMGLKPSGATPRGVVSTPAPTSTIAELKTSARSVWNDPAIKNAPIPNADATALAAGAENDLIRQGFRPTPGSAPGTFAEVQRMTPDPSIASVTVDDMRAARRALNMTAKQKDAIGGLTPDAVAARGVIEKIDNLLDGISPKLRDANADYSAAKSAELLDYRSMKAEHRAAKSGSGSNIENTMRQEVDKIPDRGLKPAERELRDKITEGDFTRNTLRKIGKLGFNDGLTMMYHAGLALPTGGANLPVGAAATVARKIGESLTAKQIKQLNEMIRARSPLSRSLPAIQAQPPSPLLGATVPYQFSQGLPIFRGAVPAYANQDEPRRR